MTFRRTALTGMLPEPVRGGSFDALWALVNVSADYRPLLKAWPVSLLWPNVPHTIVVITGEQGTGKSTAMRFFAAVIDTSPAQTRKPPKDADAWVTAAAASWVVALDNLTAIPEWLSNALCRASTGEGDVRRTYYTTADVTVIAFRRVVIINGIDLGDMADDLTDRAIPVGLDVIPETERTYEEDLPGRWRAAHPGILGAVLDLAVEVMRKLPDARLAERPRMADYARILRAVDLIDGTTGLDTYKDLIGQLAADTAENITTLINITNAVKSEWEGTAKELLETIRPGDPAWKPPRDYPKDGRAMSAELRKRAPTLRRLGWTVKDLGANNHAKVVRWRLVPPREGSDQRERGSDTRDTRTTPSEQPELDENAAGIAAGIAEPHPRDTRTGREAAGIAGMPDRGTRTDPRSLDVASSQVNDHAAGIAGIAGGQSRSFSRHGLPGRRIVLDRSRRQRGVVGMRGLIEMLAQGRQAGLTLTLTRGDDDTLRIRGPRSAGPVARELLGRKEDVLTAVSVYNGAAPRLDWRKGQILDQPQPCVLCGKRTLLIEPYDGRPCHKTCAEAAIRWGTAPAAKKGQAA